MFRNLDMLFMLSLLFGVASCGDDYVVSNPKTSPMQEDTPQDPVHSEKCDRGENCESDGESCVPGATCRPVGSGTQNGLCALHCTVMGSDNDVYCTSSCTPISDAGMDASCSLGGFCMLDSDTIGECTEWCAPAECDDTTNACDLECTNYCQPADCNLGNACMLPDGSDGMCIAVCNETICSQASSTCTPACYAACVPGEIETAA